MNMRRTPLSGQKTLTFASWRLGVRSLFRVLASWREIPLPRLGVMFLFASTGTLVERRTDLVE
jgi:hypothetical protein